MARLARLLRRLIPSSALLAVAACGKSQLATGLDNPDPYASPNEHSCEKPPLQVQPVSAALAGDRLWIVSANGNLYSFDRAFASYRVYPELAPIYRVVTGGDHALYALAAIDHSVRVHRLGENGREQRGFPVTLRDTNVLATSNTADGIAVVDTDHIAWVRADGTFTTHAAATGPTQGAERLRAAWTRDGALHVGAWVHGGGGLRTFRPDGKPTSPAYLIGPDDGIVDVIAKPDADDKVLLAMTGDHRKDRVGESGPSSFGYLATEMPSHVSSIAARKSSILAIDMHQDVTRLMPTGQRRTPLAPVPRCGVTVSELDEAWVFPSFLSTEPRGDIVVMKP